VRVTLQVCSVGNSLLAVVIPGSAWYFCVPLAPYMRIKGSRMTGIHYSKRCQIAQTVFDVVSTEAIDTSRQHFCMSCLHIQG